MLNSELRSHRGYAIIEDDKHKHYIGHIKKWIAEEGGNELVLKNPAFIDIDQSKITKIGKKLEDDVKSIVFLRENIRKVYLIPVSKDKIVK